MGPYKAVALHSSPQIPSNNDKHFKFVLIETGKKKKISMTLQQLLKICH